MMNDGPATAAAARHTPTTVRGLDADGYIEPEVSLSRLQAPFVAITARLQTLCIERFGAVLHSIYLCGSVVRGAAIVGVSDLDVLVALRAKPDEAWREVVDSIAATLEAEYAVVTGVGIGLDSYSNLLSPGEHYDMGFFLKTLCACLHGDDLSTRLPHYRPSIEVARATNGNIGQRLVATRDKLMRTEQPAEIRLICRGIMRKIVRTGFTLVMPRYNGWTSDLDRQVDIFASYYPEQGAAMGLARDLARLPSDDKRVVLDTLDTLGAWLTERYDAVIMGS